MRRYLVIFLGLVQGVGFRYNALRLANSLNLTGYVKNRIDGSVECQIQGDSNKINEFISQIQNANFYIRVSDYSMKPLPVEANESSFIVK